MNFTPQEKKKNFLYIYRNLPFESFEFFIIFMFSILIFNFPVFQLICGAVNSRGECLFLKEKKNTFFF